MKFYILLLFVLPINVLAQERQPDMSNHNQEVQRMQQEQQRQAQQQAAQQQAAQRQAAQQQAAQQQVAQQQAAQQQAAQQQAAERERLRQEQERLKQEQERLRLEQERNNQEQARIKQEQERISAEKERARQAYLGKLKNFRNNEVQNQYDKAIRERILSIQAKEDLKSIKNELLSKSWWHRQDAALLAGIIASDINAISFLIFNLLEFDPKNPSTPVISISLEVLDEMLIKGEFNEIEIAKIIRDAAISEKALEGNTLLQLVKVFKDFGVKIGESTELPESQRRMRNEIRAQLERIDQEILRYERQINDANQIINAKDKIIQSIDKYLEQNTKKP